MTAALGVVYEGPEVMDIWLEVVEVGVTCKEVLPVKELSEAVDGPAAVEAGPELVMEAEPVVKVVIFKTESPVKTPVDEVSRGFGEEGSICLTRSIQDSPTAFKGA
jgi:hypothetical protein